MIYKSEDALKKEVEQKEKELKKVKSELKTREEKRRLAELGRDIFDKQFGLDLISDNYNIYPQEQYFSIQSRFCEGFSETDEGCNKHLLKELREQYIDFLETDVKQLQELLNNIKKQHEDMETK